MDMSSFPKELQLIDELYFPVLNEKEKKWYIRKWNARKQSLRAKSFYEVLQDSVPICEVPYGMLDQRILDDMRRCLYNARYIKELILSVDKNNDRIEEVADAEMNYISRYMAKRIYKYYREPTIFGGVSSPSRPYKY